MYRTKWTKKHLISHTVGGRIPAPVDIYIYIYRLSHHLRGFYTYIPGGAGFLPNHDILHILLPLLNPDEFHIREVLRYILGAILKPEKGQHHHVEPQPSWKLRPYIPFFSHKSWDPVENGVLGPSKNEFPFHLAQFSTKNHDCGRKGSAYFTWEKKQKQTTPLAATGSRV